MLPADVWAGTLGPEPGSRPSGESEFLGNRERSWPLACMGAIEFIYFECKNVSCSINTLCFSPDLAEYKCILLMEQSISLAF